MPPYVNTAGCIFSKLLIEINTSLIQENQISFQQLIAMHYTNISRLRFLAWFEGMSFLLLIGIGMPLKYIYQIPLPNMIIGMAHGILFIAYCIWVMIVRSEEKWLFKKTFLALVASLLPFGTFVADAKIFKNNSLHK